MELIVLGYHRSGTSLIAHYLSECGLFMGWDLLGAAPSNPNGHFEDCEIFNLHQNILKRHGEMWLLKRPFVPIIQRFDLDEARQIVYKRDAMALWGFKDPRTCLFSGLWKWACSDPRWIVPLRHYGQCIDSIIRRAKYDYDKGISVESNRAISSSPEWCARSWLQYMLRVLSIVENDSENCFVFQITHEIKEAILSKSINNKFGSDLDEKPLSEIFDASLLKDKPVVIKGVEDKTQLAMDKVWNRLCCYTETLV